MEGTFPTGSRRFSNALWTLLATALAASPAGCSQYVGTTAASFLRKVQNDPDPNVRYVAYNKLAQLRCYDNEAQKAAAVQTMLAKLEEGKEPVATRAAIVHTLGVLGDPASRDVVVRLANDPEPIIRVEACRALGKVGKPEDATVLARLMTIDRLEDCRIAAIESLGTLKPKDDRITEMLLGGMRHEDPATRLASLDALKSITGKDFGVDPEAWRKALAPGATSVGATKANMMAGPVRPSYPPRPAPPVDRPDPDAQTASFSDPQRTAAPATSGFALPPGTATQNYPAHNPNLPPAPAPR